MLASERQSKPKHGAAIGRSPEFKRTTTFAPYNRRIFFPGCDELSRTYFCREVFLPGEGINTHVSSITAGHHTAHDEGGRMAPATPGVTKLFVCTNATTSAAIYAYRQTLPIHIPTS